MRLINAFSEKAENHAPSVALHCMHDNFCCRVTPAMASSVTERLWDVADLVAVLEQWETAQLAAKTEAA